MAKEKIKATEEDNSEGAASEGAKKGLPTKTIIMVLVMLVVEAVGIIGVMTVLGKPDEVQAMEFETSAGPRPEDLIEIPLLNERLTNGRTGRTFLYDTEIIILVRRKNEERVTRVLDENMAQIRTELSRLWSAAEPAYFKEPGRDTLTRQTHESLRRLIGEDRSPKGDGEALVQAVLIPKCLGFAADF